MGVHPKVAGAAGGTALGGPVVIVFLWLLSLWNVPTPSPDVVAALGTIVSTILAAVGGWLIPSPPLETAAEAAGSPK